MSESLNGKVVIVTGASSGIGAATVRLLHQAGAHPVLAARRASQHESLSKELDGALAVPTDVTVPEQVRALVQRSTDSDASTAWSTTPGRARSPVSTGRHRKRSWIC